MTGGPAPVETPVFQVLTFKKITPGNGVERYRILLSDGEHLQCLTLLATQLNRLITNGDLAPYGIIKVSHYIVSIMNKAGENEKQVFLESTVVID